MHSSRPLQLSLLLQYVIISALVLSIFSPSIFSGFCNIDDLDMVNSYRSLVRPDLHAVFFPHGGGGLYYRPIIRLSFMFDRFILDLNAPLMHLHNVILHLANTLLLFGVARRAVCDSLGKNSMLPFAVAALFGIHPLATESVNWISGRTDLLSAFFLLLATLCLLCYRETRSRWNGYAAMLCIALAVLTKEFALAFLPGALLIMAAHEYADEETALIRRNNINIRRAVLASLIISLLVVALFLLLRLGAFSSNSSRIAMTFKFLFVDPLHTSKVFLGAFAFYLKKIFFPWPLNFAIVEIDPLYELLALPLLIVCLFALFKRNMASAFFLTGILLFTPSFVIAFNQIAWTPYAERYAYLSTAYVVLGTCWYVRIRWWNRFELPLISLVILLICLTAGTTLGRNLTWQSNFKLISDTVAKSPDVADIRLLYGAQLAELGQYDDAMAQFELGKHLPGLGYDERFDLNIAAILLERHQTDQAVEVLEEAVRRSKGSSTKPIRELLTLLDRKLIKSHNAVEREATGRRIISLRKNLFKLTKDKSQFDAMRKTAHFIGDIELERRFSSLCTKP